MTITVEHVEADDILHNTDRPMGIIDWSLTRDCVYETFYDTTSYSSLISITSLCMDEECVGVSESLSSAFQKVYGTLSSCSISNP